MNDQELGKKLVEEDAFCRFADAYGHATGRRLEIVARHERPDFVCCGEDGALCGLEITQVYSDPDEIILRGPSRSPVDAAQVLYDLITEKDRKRQDPHWDFPNDTMLVVCLMDCSLTELLPILMDSLADDMAETGFSEIWLADHTTIDAFREVEISCISPQASRADYPRAHAHRKPYG